MTEMRDSTEGRVAERRAGNEVTREMADVDHTHPYTGEPFDVSFRRGVTVAADGGTSEPETDDEADPMAAVDHEGATEGASRSFERGTEGKDESV